MLDAFLTVAYEREQKHDEQVKLAKNMAAVFTLEELQKIANGEAKMAFGDCEDWIEKFKGTPMFDQALQLERQEIENDIAREQAQAAMPSTDEYYRTGANLRLQKKMLDLKLVESTGSPAGAMAAAGASPVGLEPTPADPVAETPGAVPDPAKMAMAFKQAAEKIAIIGPLADIGNLGIPSAIGYHVGKDVGRKDVEKGLPADEASLLAGAMIPGYIGYRYGKGAGREEATHMKHKAAFAKAAAGMNLGALGQQALGFAKAHPKAVGAGIGAVGGAIAGGPGNRIAGAAGGAALGHAAGGVAGGMANGASLGEAAKAYGGGLKSRAMDLKNKAVGAWNNAAPPVVAP